MAETPESNDAAGRGGDRRGRDRRKTDRRAPTPPWRRPWALVAYGVVSAFVLMLILNGLEGEEEEVPLTVRSMNSPQVADTTRAASSPIRNGFTAADFEKLTAEGGAAVGQRVRTELYCESISSVSLRSVDTINPSLSSLADANRRVPAAECKWGGASGSAQDLLLIVPPVHAEQFGSAPTFTEDFVSRRRVRGIVEWLGRSDALALRTAAILRSISDAP